MPEAKMYLDKRVYPRFPVQLPVLYQVLEEAGKSESVSEWRKKARQANTLDMSLGGVGITVDQKLSLGSVLRLDITLPGSPKPLTIFAEVVWTAPEKAGLHFLMVKDEDVALLKACLQKNPA